MPPPFKPLRWLTHSPVAILPLLAAVFIQGPAPEALEEASALPDLMPLVQRHWYWLSVALGLGVWVGWSSASGGDADGEAETAEDAR